MPICKQYFAKVDEYGFPIPGTMMGFNGTPGTCDLALACSMVQQIFRPGGLRYFVVLDSNGYIRPNSLMARFTVPQGVRTAEFIKYIPAA
jgi:hypothetical protein